MLKKLRLKMIVTCLGITATILAIVCIISFCIFNTHYKNETTATLENQLTNLVLTLQQQKTISHTYLSQLQATHNTLIYIEDHGTPLLFQNQLESTTMQQQLFDQAKEIALTTYNFNFSPFYLNSLELSTLSFRFNGVNHKDYLAALALFPTETGQCQVILLKDLETTHIYIFYMKLLFIGLALVGTLLLVIFSFWFVSIALKPIKQNQQRQAEFIAAASHELRAPLTVIESGLTSLESHEMDAHHASHFIGLMQNECTRMKRLISDLLTLARSDAHQWHMQFSEVEIDSLLIDLYDSFYCLCTKKGLTLSLQLPDELLPRITCDGDRIKQALTILLDNALSYVPAGNSITLSTSMTSKALEIQVIDTGIGISKTDQEHIFDRFYQGDRSRHEKNHYGLGLNIAMEIIQLHHGKLSLTDTPGGGCTFTISLPY
ncbi:MAG: HAMP domain-containing histidine kinase [Cellulosilyticum sp.]|nr:HAMP domain-containing histidine kinase [Cellulosilyticum sp.]